MSSGVPSGQEPHAPADAPDHGPPPRPARSGRLRGGRAQPAAGAASTPSTRRSAPASFTLRPVGHAARPRVDPRRRRQGPPRGAPADRRRRRHGHDQHSSASPSGARRRHRRSRSRPASSRCASTVAYLDGDRKVDRDTTVVHELGHVIDFALMPDELRDQLAAQLPEQRRLLHRRHRRLHRARGALRRHVRQVGAARRGLGRRRRLQHALARVAGELGRAAGDAGDRGRGRLAVDRPLVARRAVAAQLDERERRARARSGRAGRPRSAARPPRAAAPARRRCAALRCGCGRRSARRRATAAPHDLVEAVDEVRREVDDDASPPAAARPAARAAGA